MKVGIFKNKIAQGTIEYILACMLAIGAASICITILKPIFVDCMIVDSCGVANAGGNIEELAIWNGTDEYLNFDGIWDAPEFDFEFPEEVVEEKEKKPSIWDDAKNDFTRSMAKKSEVLDAVCANADCSIINFKVQTTMTINPNSDLYYQILSDRNNPAYAALALALQQQRQQFIDMPWRDQRYQQYLQPVEITFNQVLKVTQTPPEMNHWTDALTHAAFNENGKTYWVLETTAESFGQSNWQPSQSETRYIKENGEYKALSAQELAQIEAQNAQNSRAYNDMVEMYKVNGMDIRYTDQYQWLKYEYPQTTVYQEQTNEILGSRYVVPSTPTRMNGSVSITW